MNVEISINDSAEEYLMNLAAQGYYSETWEFIIRATDHFNWWLYQVAAEAMNLELKQINCPDCKTPLVVKNSIYSCPKCEENFTKEMIEHEQKN